MNRKQLIVDSYMLVDGSTCKQSTRKPATSNHPAFALLLLAGTLLLLLALAFLPQPALAATPITNCTELQNIKNNLAGDYYLANDIDCSCTSGWNGGAGFRPIGTESTKFTGTFDGKGYKITNLYINRTSTDYVGLFGYTYGSGSEIKDVGLEEVDVSGDDRVGGLVGHNYKGKITNSYSSGSVSGSQSVGGLVGWNYGGTITNSYSSGSVSGSSYVGGLVGYNYRGTITNSYSSGSVSGNDIVGGLVGHNYEGTITNSYYPGDDITCTGCDNSIGKTTKANLQSQTWLTTPPNNWDFDNIWGIVEGVTYPYLRWQFACTCGDICVNTTGWWRDGGEFKPSNMPIQHAIENATAGDTICVKDGTYNETVDVTKSHLTIRSEHGPSVTTVSASLYPDEDVFKISDQTNVTLEGFEIRDAYGTSLDVAGIYMYNASECNISGNIVTNISTTGYNYAYGIYLDSSSYNSFDTSTVYNLDANDSSAYGIYLSSSSDNSFVTSTIYNLSSAQPAYGIYLYSSSDNSFHTSTVYNLSSANGCAIGIPLSYSSDNSFHTSTVFNLNAKQDAYGIPLSDSSYNSFHTSTVYNLSSADNNAYGIWLQDSSDNNSFHTSTVYNLSSAKRKAYGIWLRYSSDNNSFDTSTVYNLSATQEANGIYLRSSSDNSFSSSSISDINAPTWRDFYSDKDAHGNRARDITISSIATTISFTYDNGIKLKSVANPPADPAGKRNISKYVHVTEVTADSWIFMNVSYEEGDLVGVDENSLRLWKHNGTDWTEVSGTNGVNTAENYVYANITEFSVFAPLGNVTCVKLGINKTGVPDPVSPGGTLNYTISVNNTGNAPTTNVTVKETYDGNVTFVSAVPAPSQGNDTWIFATLNVSETRWINISVIVNVSVLNGTVLHNIVNVTCDEGVNDSDTADTTVLFKELNCTCGDICVNTTGWWRDGGAFIASGTPIQDAINNAIAGDTICVKDGTYNETVDVTKSHLTIRSEHGPSVTTVSASLYPNEHVFKISDQTNVTLEGFEIRDAHGTNKNVAGIYMDNACECNISGNIVTDISATGWLNDAYGIWLRYSNDNSFVTTTVYNLSSANRYAYGIYLEDSSDNSFVTSTIYNLSSADKNAYGIWLSSSSDNNSFHTSTVYNLSAAQEAYGIWLYSSSDNLFDTSTTVYNLSADRRANGIWLYSSSDNSFDTTTFYNLSAKYAYGIYLWGSSDNNSFLTSTVYNLSSAKRKAYGIYLDSSSDNNSFSSGSISGVNAPTWWDFYSEEDAHGNSAENITISSFPTTISFTYENGIMLKSVETPPADPAGKRNIGKYVNVTDVTADSWIFMNVSYSDGDLDGIDEDSFRMWGYNGTDWTEVPGTNGVNTAENYVYANITEFSVFAPLGNVTGVKLEINKTGVPDPVPAGGTLNYSIRVNNTGNAKATNVTVMETYDGNVTFVVAVPAPALGNDTWEFTSLNVSETRWINISVTVNASVLNGTVLHNVVNVTCDEGVSDSDTENTTVFAAPVPALEIKKTGAPDPVLAGGTLNYSISVNNTGNATATNVTVKETYDGNVTFVTAVPAPSQVNDTWVFATLNASETRWINISVTVNASVLNGTVLHNIVNVTCDEGVMDSDTEDTTVLSVLAPVLEINKTGVPDPVLAGGTLNYSINVNNTGNATATNVTVMETYDGNVTFVTAAPAPSPGNDTWKFATLNASETRWINISVTVNASVLNGTVLHNFVNVSCDEKVADYDVENTTVFSDVVHITSFAPPSPVNDTVCNWRTFNVSVDQTVNVSWYLNGSLLFTNKSVRDASCRLHADAAGVHNVSAIASNANSSDMQTWIWNVTAGLNCTCGDICVNETGWWRDGEAFFASNTPIQAAINSATVGDTICVMDGTYNETVDVTKSHLTIRSENGPSVTTVSASLDPNRPVFKISDQTNVTLKGFEIRDAHKGTSKRVAGIYMYNASECNISGNIVTNISATGYNNAYGIYLDHSSDNSFHTSTVYNISSANGYAYGIRLYYSSDNSFDTSTFTISLIQTASPTASICLLQATTTRSTQAPFTISLQTPTPAASICVLQVTTHSALAAYQTSMLLPGGTFIPRKTHMETAQGILRLAA